MLVPFFFLNQHKSFWLIFSFLHIYSLQIARQGHTLYQFVQFFQQKSWSIALSVPEFRHCMYIRIENTLGETGKKGDRGSRLFSDLRKGKN